MFQENRIRNLSTRWLSIFKVLLIGLYVIACLSASYVFLFDGGVFKITGIMMMATYGWLFYLLIRMTAKLHRIEFDDAYMYVLKKDQDLIIPLQNIESVEIATFGGVYKVNLYHADQVGKEFYFKQSLWYPLNFKRCDALVNVLRKNIQLAKSRVSSISTNALHS